MVCIMLKFRFVFWIVEWAIEFFKKHSHRVCADDRVSASWSTYEYQVK